MIRLWLAVLCGYLALGATLQVLPDFTTRHFAAGPALVGLVIGVASLSAAVLRPVAGRAADTGRARWSVLAAGAFGVLGGLGHLWSPNLTVLIGARLLLGASEGAIFVAAVAWVLRAARPERRGGIAGWFGLSIWAGVAVGPVLAVWLGHIGGLDAVWAAVILLPAIGFALTLSTRSPARSSADTQIGVHPGVHRRLLPPSARLPGLIMGLSSYGYGTIATLLLLRLRHGGLGGESAALAVFAIAFLITRAAGSPLVDRLGGAQVAIVSSIVEAVGLFLVGGATGLHVALVGVAISGAGVALVYPAMVAITVERTTPEEQGAAVGVMTSFWDLAIVVAGPIGGLVAHSVGYPVAFGLAGVIAIAAALLTLRLRHSGNAHDVELKNATLDP
ncbi:MAG: MFS transporter [Gemmatimonadaceae bacterium]